MCPPAWSLVIVENLECLTNLRVILAQGPCRSSLYCSSFNKCVAVKNKIIQPYNSIDKSFSLVRQTRLLVTLNYRSFAPSLHYQGATWDAWRWSWLNVTWASKHKSRPSPTYWQYREGVSAGMVTWDCRKFGMLFEMPCHPCAGAMLIFCVSFQF